MRNTFDDSSEAQAYTPRTTKPEDRPMSCPQCSRSTTWGVLSELGNRCGVCFDAYRRQPIESVKAMKARHAAMRQAREAAAAKAEWAHA